MIGKTPFLGLGSMLAACANTHPMDGDFETIARRREQSLADLEKAKDDLMAYIADTRTMEYEGPRGTASTPLVYSIAPSYWRDDEPNIGWGDIKKPANLIPGPRVAQSYYREPLSSKQQAKRKKKNKVARKSRSTNYKKRR